MFKEIGKSLLNLPLRRSSNLAELQIKSPFQETGMKEKIIVVDEYDHAVGAASKLDCHKIQSDGSLILHRAFSLFIFNSKGEILLQRRSGNKVTFPNYIANACCSHPLYEIEEERNEINAIGVKKAAQRRMSIELGVPKEQTTLDDFQYITRLIYRFYENKNWGEHELDYILFLQKDISIDPNPEEIASVKFISQKDFDKSLANLQYPISPWFSLFVKHFLKKWWNNLGNLDSVKDHTTIHRFY